MHWSPHRAEVLMEDEPTQASFFFQPEPSVRPPKSVSPAAELSWEVRVDTAVTEVIAALLWPEMGIDEVTELVLEHAKALSGSADGFISSLDPATGADHGHTKPRLPECAVDQSVCGKPLSKQASGVYPGLWGVSLNTGRGFFTNAPARSVPRGHVAVRAFLAVPAMVGTQLFGQIALANPSTPYTDKMLQGVGRLADLLALALERARLQEALRAVQASGCAASSR